MFIYVITNIANGKVYVGQSRHKNEKLRICNGHIGKLELGKHSNKHLQASWKKYGKANFVFEVVHRNVCSFEMLDSIEIDLIHKFDSTNPKKGYNKAAGGAVRMKDIKAWNKGLPKEKQPRFGKKLSIEARRRLDERMANFVKKEKPIRPKKYLYPKQKKTAWNKGMPAHFHPSYGLKRSDETKQKQSIAAKQRKYSEEELAMARINGANNSRSVICQTTGEKFSSVTAAAQHFQTKRVRICEVLSGNKKAWKGLVFSYGI